MNAASVLAGVVPIIMGLYVIVRRRVLAVQGLRRPQRMPMSRNQAEAVTAFVGVVMAMFGVYALLGMPS
jgi:hypothetical protein